MRRGEQVSAWHSTGVTAAVGLICASPVEEPSEGGRVYAVAYADGSIRLWMDQGMDGVELVTFNGHKKSPTALRWDAAGTRVFSGGAEGEIVVWDVVDEVGLYRLKGHRGPVTAIEWLPHPEEGGHPGWLLTTSKDGLMKLWDLQVKHCVQTVVVGRGEVLSCAVREDAQGWHVVTGSGDGECKVWRMEREELKRGLIEDASGKASSPHTFHGSSVLNLPSCSYNPSSTRSVPSPFHPPSQRPSPISPSTRTLPSHCSSSNRRTEPSSSSASGAPRNSRRNARDGGSGKRRSGSRPGKGKSWGRRRRRPGWIA